MRYLYKMGQKFTITEQEKQQIRGIYEQFNPPKTSEQQLKGIVRGQQKYDAILIGGLDTRPGDKPIGEQVSLLKNSSGLNNIKGFRFNEPDSNIKMFIESNPNLPVVLFSKGCEKTKMVLNTKGVDPNKVFVIQPWAGNSGMMSYYNGLSMTRDHIYVGDGSSTGLGISGATRCPKGMGHWASLPAIGGMVLKMFK